MTRILSACLAIAAAAGAAQQPTEETTSTAPLIRTGHLIGDQYGGFRNGCLVVYGNGRYHREAARQTVRGGRPTALWETAKVFEGTIETGEMEQLKKIVDAEEFRSVSGTLGKLPWMNLMVTPDGIVPHGDIEVFEATLVRGGGLQVFHVIGPTPREQAATVDALKRWVGGVEKLKQPPVPNAIPTSCDVSSVQQGRIKLPSVHTRLRPVPLETPGPVCAMDERMAQTATGVAVHILVDPDGNVTGATVRHGVNPALDQCAVDAVKRWKFLPASLSGVAVPMGTDLEVEFTRAKGPEGKESEKQEKH